AILHEWMTQATRAGATNEQAEGFSPSFAAANQTARVRRTNPVQVLAVPFSVSGTQDAVDKAGIGTTPEYDVQKDLHLKILAKDIDFDMLQ
ncbi:SU10 major capsid protein, partial [Streptococcus pseudopneumoniae]|uniref:SU10 major capsid protein n=1 Tax=Streptococcus pseudopneumoniae TaxID=257758 RepID=UPI0018B01A23